MKARESIFFDIPKVDLTKTKNTSSLAYYKIHNNLSQHKNLYLSYSDTIDS